jgi:hypothetical protein
MSEKKAVESSSLQMFQTRDWMDVMDGRRIEAKVNRLCTSPGSEPLLGFIIDGEFIDEKQKTDCRRAMLARNFKTVNGTAIPCLCSVQYSTHH